MQKRCAVFMLQWYFEKKNAMPPDRIELSASGWLAALRDQRSTTELRRLTNKSERFQLLNVLAHASHKSTIQLETHTCCHFVQWLAICALSNFNICQISFKLYKIHCILLRLIYINDEITNLYRNECLFLIFMHGIVNVIFENWFAI